ncbi:MAG: hypothetical protein N2572_06540 [Syntrophales bacterium]|nr:hypothetical protein [Syntrophales bacterium]
MTVLLEQTEKMLGLFLNENSNLSEEGRKAITEWIDRCREGRHEFSRNAQESYKKIEQTLF